MTYQQWDTLADAYTPIIGVFCLIWIGRVLILQGIKVGAMHLLATLLSTLFIYILMFADNVLNIWSILGLDYSTHTALALVFICYFIVHEHKVRWIAVVSIVAYAILMMYQNYHTLADILTTAICVTPFLLLTQIKVARFMVRE